jgi:hypothetical protein
MRGEKKDTRNEPSMIAFSPLEYLSDELGRSREAKLNPQNRKEWIGRGMGKKKQRRRNAAAIGSALSG